MNQELKPLYRAGVYLAPAAYGEAVAMEQALSECQKYLGNREELSLTRIYRDEEVTVLRTPDRSGRRTPLGVSGNDAWQRLLRDTETLAIEAVVVYAARTVAPSISGLSKLIREYFLPFGIRFIDVEASFDTKTGDTDCYLRRKTSEYRSSLCRKPYSVKSGKKVQL
ncbi:MAG: hypothetical protein LUG86_08300 [Oscillospiraceae bacterium]|nr:hypothetical protein [Oscillospiraceae bacterium]